jgi:hypothetical protein
MVIAHSCEYTKAVKQPERPLGVAPLELMDSLPHGQPTLARRNELARYWPLPETYPLEAGYAVDFANLQPVVASDLVQGTRITSIEDNGQILLAARVFSFYAQREFVP